MSSSVKSRGSGRLLGNRVDFGWLLFHGLLRDSVLYFEDLSVRPRSVTEAVGALSWNIFRIDKIFTVFKVWVSGCQNVRIVRISFWVYIEMAEGRGPLGNRHPAPRLLRPWSGLNLGSRVWGSGSSSYKENRPTATAEQNGQNKHCNDSIIKTFRLDNQFDLTTIGLFINKRVYLRWSI